MIKHEKLKQNTIFGEFIIRWRWLLLTLLTATLAVSLYLLPGIEINQDFTNHFPDEDPDLAFYETMTSELGDEDDMLMVAVHRPEGIFDSLFLKDFHAFARALSELPNILHAQYLTKMQEPQRTAFATFPRPLLRFTQPAFYVEDSVRLLGDKRLHERFISADLKTLAVILEMKQEMNSRSSEDLVASIERIGGQYDFRDMHIMGRKYFEVSYNRISNKELKKGFGLCLVLILAALGILYRSFWAVTLPVLVYTSAIVVFLGYLVLRGHPLDAMTNLVPTILLIVSISNVVHLFSKYEDLAKTELDKRAALKNTLNDTGLVIFLTSFTTAIGFLTMLTSDLPGMRKFGGDIAMGVMIAFLITFILVPFVLYYIPAASIHIRADLYRSWKRCAGWVYQTVLQNSKWILRLSMLCIAVCILGLLRINTNNFFISSLPGNDPAHDAVNFFENNLGGVRTFEIALTATVLQP